MYHTTLLFLKTFSLAVSRLISYLCAGSLPNVVETFTSLDSFMNQVSPSPETLSAAREAVDVLQRGGIILYPTDTIWGLGCDATNEEAVDRLSALKGRPTGKPMLMLVDSDMRIPSYVRTVPSMAYQLIDVAVRPLTIIYPGGAMWLRNYWRTTAQLGYALRAIRSVRRSADCYADRSYPPRPIWRELLHRTTTRRSTQN